MVYNNVNLITGASLVELVKSGLCYYNSDCKAHFAYPDNIVTESLQKDMIALFADYAKGPALNSV